MEHSLGQCAGAQVGAIEIGRRALLDRAWAEATRARLAGEAELVWADEQLLLDEGVNPWMELPLWVPGDWAAFLQMGVSKAIAAGLAFRPLEETARDTLAWARESGAQLVTETQYGSAGLGPAREAELLATARSS